MTTPAFILKSFRIYNDSASAELIIDGVGEIDAKIDIPKELLAQIKEVSIEGVRSVLLKHFEKKSEVVKLVNIREKTSGQDRLDTRINTSEAVSADSVRDQEGRRKLPKDDDVSRSVHETSCRRPSDDGSKGNNGS